MARIEFPEQLNLLLKGSDLQAPIRALADQVSVILTENQMPFFPHYTDHGTEHVQSVLKSEVALVPDTVWEQSHAQSSPRVLCDADAAVIIGATLLHDIAMHLRRPGFLALISKDSRFKPLPWFDAAHTDHAADRAWDVLWADYEGEARRFSDHDLENIIGKKAWKYEGLPQGDAAWDDNHYLVIGEFIRRHHARLAHEIAMHGMPGVDEGAGEHQFPAMGSEEGHKLGRLADLIGLTARSHGTSLRVCQAYLEKQHEGELQPMGTAVLYPMALLRVADYLQIEGTRAPAVLLQLHQPQSPISLDEWRKHKAVEKIGPAKAARCLMIRVSNKISHRVYLQLRDLLVGLQAEIDHSTAVLDEAYGKERDLELDQLNLSIRRVDSNLRKAAFLDKLEYVPERTGFTADPSLLTLLVEPLYGKECGVGVRELMQNALDAVREARAWCANHDKPLTSIGFPKQEPDVLIEYIKRDEAWFVRVQDKGIGMTSHTLQHYFLRAGASFRRSGAWGQEFLKENGQPRLARAGHFGIGAFAVFLLGPSFRLYTRHVSAGAVDGYELAATNKSELIEIKRVRDLPVGTVIEVQLSRESVQALDLETKLYSDSAGPQRKVDWYCSEWPTVLQRVVRDQDTLTIPQRFMAPFHNAEPPPEWSVIHPEKFDAVYWTHGKAPKLSCNGLRIGPPDASAPDTGFFWDTVGLGLLPPHISIFDSRANLELTTQRYALTQPFLPFLEALVKDVMLSFIAHALVCGPTNRHEALFSKNGHPLRMPQQSLFGDLKTAGMWSASYAPFHTGHLRWCATSSNFVPSDEWLYTLLGGKSCIVLGSLEIGNLRTPDKLELRIQDKLETACEKMIRLVPADVSLLHWRGIYDSRESHEEKIQRAWKASMEILNVLAEDGLESLGHHLVASKVLASITEELHTHPKSLTQSGRIRELKELKFESWKHLRNKSCRRARLSCQTADLTCSLKLQDMLEAMETTALSRSPSPESDPEMLFISELSTRPKITTPKSPLALLWNQILGAQAIPFDPAARQQMIERSGQDLELKRHLDVWQKLKQQGAKFTQRLQ